MKSECAMTVVKFVICHINGQSISYKLSWRESNQLLPLTEYQYVNCGWNKGLTGLLTSFMTAISEDKSRVFYCIHLNQ
jgi:hypothetical protein